jgi:hypothetical protein
MTRARVRGARRHTFESSPSLRRHTSTLDYLVKPA